MKRCLHRLFTTCHVLGKVVDEETCNECKTRKYIYKGILKNFEGKEISYIQSKSEGD